MLINVSLWNEILLTNKNIIMKRLFIVSLLLLCCTYTAEVFAQGRSGKSQNPLNYPYYIYGEQQVKGNNLSILRNIKYKGFKSTNTKKFLLDSLKNTEHENISPNLVNGLGEEIYEKFLYEFNAISTVPEISLDDKRLQYWWKDEDGEWWSDVEAGNGIANKRTDKEAFFILVLDCSKSLEDDFKEVQAGAWAFIEEMYKSSNPNKGNIKIGIMYFSSMRNTDFFPITPLTHSNKENMYEFIYGRHNDTKATAMYYAVNKGLDSLVKYENERMQNIPDELYGGTHIITFTDGLDNTSQVEKQNLYTVPEVKKFVENKVHTIKIKNDKIVSWVIGTQGGDVQDEQLEKMKRQLKTLASSDDHFIWMKKMSECIGTFKNIAKSCSKQWQNLSCTSSLSHAGPVCWTLGEVKAPKAPKASKAKGQWFINAVYDLVAPIYEEDMNMFLGLMGGYLGKWGGYLKISPNIFCSSSHCEGLPVVTAGVTKRFCNWLHMYLGIGAAPFYDDFWGDNDFEGDNEESGYAYAIDLGFIIKPTNHFNINVGYSGYPFFNAGFQLGVGYSF